MRGPNVCYANFSRFGGFLVFQLFFPPPRWYRRLTNDVFKYPYLSRAKYRVLVSLRRLATMFLVMRGTIRLQTCLLCHRNVYGRLFRRLPINCRVSRKGMLRFRCVPFRRDSGLPCQDVMACHLQRAGRDYFRHYHPQDSRYDLYLPRRERYLIRSGLRVRPARVAFMVLKKGAQDANRRRLVVKGEDYHAGRIKRVILSFLLTTADRRDGGKFNQGSIYPSGIIRYL